MVACIDFFEMSEICLPKFIVRHSTRYAGQKILAVIVCQFKKKCNPHFIVIMIIDYRLDYERYFLGGKFQNSKLFCHFYYTERLPQVLRLSMRMIALILFIHVGFLEYLSFKQFKLIVKMTRIESGVTIPKGLFTLYLNVKKVTAKIFWPP
jgi:hypothetical protein